jgi:hypothetical protein
MAKALAADPYCARTVRQGKKFPTHQTNAKWRKCDFVLIQSCLNSPDRPPLIMPMALRDVTAGTGNALVAYTTKDGRLCVFNCPGCRSDISTDCKFICPPKGDMKRKKGAWFMNQDDWMPVSIKTEHITGPIVYDWDTMSRSDMLALLRSPNSRCWVCDTERSHYKECTKCKISKYCSRGCQKTHWAYHRNWCSHAV